MKGKQTSFKLQPDLRFFLEIDTTDFTKGILKIREHAMVKQLI